MSVRTASVRTVRRRDLRLIPIAVVAWGTAMLTTMNPEVAPWVAGGSWGLSLALLAVAGRARRSPSSPRTSVAIPLLAIAAITLAACAAVATQVSLAQAARDDLLRVDIEGGRALTVTVLVTGKVEPSATGWRFDAQARAIGHGDVARSVDAPVQIRSPVRTAGLDQGATVILHGTAFPARPGERAVLVIDASRGIEVLTPASGVLAVASELRRGLARAVDGLPQPASGLIPGLSVGDTSAVTADLDAAMKTSSLSHLTAVSGANCALVVGIAFAGAALCGARRAIRVVAGVVALAGFVILVTPEPSVVRAAAMAGIAMLGVLLGRIGAGVSILCLAVTLVLVVDPYLAGSLGFALSAAATAALLLLAGPMADGMSRWMPHPLALALSIPLAAQLACGPLLVLVTPTVPVYGVVANILAGPAAPAGTVLGLVACLTSGIPLVSSGLAALAWVPAAWVATTAEIMAGLPGGTMPWLEGWTGVVVLAVVGVAVGIVVVVRSGSAMATRTRSGAVLILAIVVGIGAGTGIVGPVLFNTVLRPLSGPGDWAVLACDVGQGDAILLRSAGQVALVDTGPAAAPLDDCLAQYSISRIDLLVLTHFDMDHRGGLDAVRGRVSVVLHGPPGGPDDLAVLEDLSRSGAELAAAESGMTGQLGGARWEVKWPRAGGRGYGPGNDSSVVLSIDGGGIPTTLLLGDLSAGPQRALATGGDLAGPYAVVKVAHHGSADQDTGLYRLLTPAVALVSVGADNTYGHPRAEILDILTSIGAVIARTDVEGDVAVRMSGDTLRVWRERAPP